MGQQYEIWVKIRAAVDNLGPNKTIKQCKEKYEILKRLIKEQKKATKRLELRQVFHLTLIEEIYGCRDVMNFPEKSEVGANSISDDV